MRNYNTAELVKNVCEMPKKFEALSNVSMIDLIAQSGYISSPQSLTEARIRRFLSDHPSCVQEWLIHSENQRCSPAWFLSELGSHSVNDKRWEVGYFAVDCSVTLQKEFSDQISATAHYIKMEAQALARFLDRG